MKDDPGTPKDARLRVAGELANGIYARVVAGVIEAIKSLPDDCRLSGDDSGLANVWDEFRDQIQNEQSIFFDAYEETIESICRKHVLKLAPDLQRWLWIWTEGFLDAWVKLDEIGLEHFDAGHVTGEVYRRVCEAAGNERVGK